MGDFHIGLFLFFFFIFWPVGAIRLAKPGSFWARRYYSEEKLARARRRHGLY